jgi:peroxiredoxin
MFRLIRVPRSGDVMRRMMLLALVVGAAACGQEADRFRAPGIGDPAPPGYGAPVLGGDTLRLVQLRGDPVMLNVWATWCPPCREEMPGLQALHERYGGRGLQVVAVSIDSRGSEPTIEAFLQEYGVTFTILHDVAEDISTQFRTPGVPATFLLDRDGIIVHRWIGKFDPMADDVTARVEALLDAGR